MKAIRRRDRYAMRKGLLLLALLTTTSLLSAQSDLSSDRNQIARLLTGLSDHSLKPSDVLDPALSSERRQDSLGYFEDPSYSLAVVPVGPIQIDTDGSATVPVKVEFKNANKEISAQSTIQFVRRNQVWYFADFAFVAFPASIIVVIVIGSLVGISYASGVLLLRGRLVRLGRLDWGNRVKIFIPVFWPRLFRER